MSGHVRFAFLVAAAALMTAGAAHADSISLTLLAPTASFSGGTETLTYDATVAAPSSNSADVFLNGDALNVNGPLTADDTDFLINFPLSLSKGASFTGDLFTVTVPYGAPLGVYNGSFVLIGGSDDGAQDTLATANFAVAITPEPASLALLTTGVSALAAVWARKRKARTAV